MYPGEKIFKSECDITYLFQKPQQPCRYMLVIFSGFSLPGQPPMYNYIRTLNSMNCYKLFILDNYGPRGCYYLGCNKNFYVASSAFYLISNLARGHNIRFQNIITAGSSKGGYAALYFGFKYRFGHVVSGAPQTLLGDYLIGLRASLETAHFVSGGTDKSSWQFLNNILFEATKTAKQAPNVYIQVGKEDHHLKEHVIPYINLLSRQNLNCTLDLVNYGSHADVAEYFPPYLISQLKTIIESDG